MAFSGKISRLLAILVCCTLWGLASTARFRGGTSYRSYRSTSYRSTTYRSATYRSGYTRYSSYVPTTRYSRGYYGYSGYYYYYYNMYYYHSNSYYQNHADNADGSTICENYAANQNGTTIGNFACPMPFEPDNFKYCCGDKYEEYCCKLADKPGMIAGIVIGVLILVAVVIVIIICVVKSSKKSSKRVQPARNVTERRPNDRTRQPRPNQLQSYGQNGTASGQYPQPGGGYYGTASGQYPQPGGGQYGTASGQYPQPGGGQYGTASGQYQKPEGGHYFGADPNTAHQHTDVAPAYPHAQGDVPYPSGPPPAYSPHDLPYPLNPNTGGMPSAHKTT